jgi:anti-anti-sigma factor
LSPRADVAWYLTIDAVDVGKKGIVLVASGRIGGATSAHLARALTGAIDQGCRGIVLDLEGVDYISSAGLRELASAAARLHGVGGQLILCGIRGPVERAIELAGSPAHVSIEPARHDAIARLVG